MIFFKDNNLKNFENVSFLIFLSFIIINGIVQHDYIISIISALCGISYTFLAGKGTPLCYIIGLTGSGFYSYLAFQNTLWGNLFLYSMYFVPMQILGFFKWQKHLKPDKKFIIKSAINKKEYLLLTIINILAIIICTYFFTKFNDQNPLLDSITTVLSLTGMYLTVKRAIQQWLIWFIVNGLAFYMWLIIALKTHQSYSTVIMWGIYLFYSIYFYIRWKQELSQTQI